MTGDGFTGMLRRLCGGEDGSVNENLLLLPTIQQDPQQRLLEIHVSHIVHLSRIQPISNSVIVFYAISLVACAVYAFLADRVLLYYGEEGGRAINENLSGLGEYGAYTSNGFLDTFSALEMMLAVVIGLWFVKNKYHYQPTQFIKDVGLRVLSLFVFFLPASNVIVQYTRNKTDNLLTVNLTYYTAFSTNLYWGAVVAPKYFQSLVESIRTPTADEKLVIDNLFGIIKENFHSYLNSDQNHFIEQLIKFRETQVFNDLFDIHMLIYEKMLINKYGLNDQLCETRSYMRRMTTQQKAMFSLKIVFVLLCLIGPVMTLLDIAMEISPNLFDNLFVPFFAKYYPDVWNAFTGASVNGIEFIMVSLDCFPIIQAIFSKTNMTNNLARGNAFMGTIGIIALVMLIGTFGNMCQAVGLVKDNPVSNNSFVKWLQMISTAFGGGLVISAIGFYRTGEWILSLLERIWWRGLITADEDQLGDITSTQLQFLGNEFLKRSTIIANEINARPIDIAKELCKRHPAVLQSAVSRVRTTELDSTRINVFLNEDMTF